MNQQVQTPGHLFGPPPPTIGFWYGPIYVGETRGHPSDIEAARRKVKRSLDVLDVGEHCGVLRARLPYASATLYCGSIAYKLTHA